MTEPDKPRGCRWGKPKKKYLRRLKVGTNHATWQPMAQAVIAAVLADQNDILVSFSYIFQYPESFPKGVLHAQEGYDDIRRIKAEKLLLWLYEQGYTEHSPTSLKAARKRCGRQLTDMENKLDSFL